MELYTVQQIWLGKNATVLISTNSNYFLSILNKNKLYMEKVFREVFFLSVSSMLVQQTLSDGEESFRVYYTSKSQVMDVPLHDFVSTKPITEKEAMQWLLTTENISS